MPAAMSLLRNLVDGGGAEEAIAFVGDDASFDVVNRFAQTAGWPGDAVCHGGPDAALDMLAEGVVPRLLLVDIDLAAEPVVQVSRLAVQCGTVGRVIAIGTPNDIALYRSMIAAGAAEYLVKPLTAEAVAAAVQAAGTPARPADAPQQRCSLSVVIGVRGGVGASTIAVNTAWLLANEQKLKTALLDLDLYFGTDALALDLEPGRGLREALEYPDRVDSLLLTSSMVSQGERLCVLGAEEPIEEQMHLDGNAALGLLRQLRPSFDCVVVDLPRALLPGCRGVLGEAENIVLVSDLSLAGIRDTARVQGMIESLGCTAACHTVISRVGGDRRAQVDRPTFERGIKGTIGFVVPEDGRTVATSANLGKPIGSVAAGSPINKVLRGLAERLSGARPRESRSLLKRLAGKVRR